MKQAIKNIIKKSTLASAYPSVYTKQKMHKALGWGKVGLPAEIVH